VLQAWEDEFLRMDDAFFTTFAHNAMRFVSRLRVFQLLWSGPVLFSYDSCWGLVQVTGLFIAQSYMHHVDRADINSSEKVDDSCS
jgi:hypothetical protein